jgi:signal transduction histidine kinase/CheY-like chemotaxis protein
MRLTKAKTDTIQVKTQVLVQLLELTEAMLQGDHSKRVVVDFDDDMVVRIVDNLNRFSNEIQLNQILDYKQEKTVNSFIEVISSFANLDFKQKLPISDNGTILDAIATGINILGEELQQSTASKYELEIERNRLREAQSIAKIGSWVLNVPSFKLAWSEEAYRIFELDQQQTPDLFGAYRQKIHPNDLPKLDSLIRSAIQKGDDFNLELRMICTDESLKYILCIGEALKGEDGQTTSLKGTMQDITKRKYDEQKLKEAKEYAEEANNAKSRFLANMSHEIRTPLNGILGLTEIMQGEDVSDEHRKYLQIVRESGKTLAQLINDILDLSKIESKNLQLENIPFSLSKIVISNVNSYKFLAEQKGLVMSYHIDESIPKEVMGDPTRVSQVITNLISNAIKFTDRGKIDISLSLSNHKKNEITVQGMVKDTGVGIPHDKLDMIFQSFTQADDSITRQYGGTGLGLSIVKNLLEQMKGSIFVESPADPFLNRGSAFIFTLKLKLSDDQVDQLSIREKGNRKCILRQKMNVLVVDDNPINLLVAKKMLQKFGAEVTIVESGHDAISLVKLNKYDLVLMDIQMPELNGYETAEELRKLNFNKPILALSANAYQEDVDKSLASGMNDHIKKPYTEEQLFDKVSKFEEFLQA